MPPSKPKFVIYFRVSTKRQGKSGLGLEAQQAAAEEYVRRMGGLTLATFREVESGKVNARPQLEAALLRCRQSRATLLIAKLDRLSRNAAFLFTLRDSGQKFVALDIPDANTLTLGVMIAMAQHERELISSRTKAALAARRARGLHLGTPRDLSAYQAAGSAKGRKTNSEKARGHALDIKPMIDAAQAAGKTSLRAIAAHLNAEQAPTPRGKQWTATAVKNALAIIA
jgi:DNA invertase Pin-like site-specific DNA recombinase